MKLRSASAPLLARVRAVPNAILYGTPNPETWSAIDILAHVAEFLPYWAHQAGKVAEGPDGVGFGRTHEDPDRIAAVVTHRGDTLETATKRVEDAVARSAGLLAAIPPSAWIRRGRHARRGEMTIAEIVQSFMFDHLEEHATQLDQLLAALQPARPDPNRSR